MNANGKMTCPAFTKTLPECTVESLKDKGKTGDPHLVIIASKDKSWTQFMILRPYREGKKWLTWFDVHGTVYNSRPNGFFQQLKAVKWVDMKNVDKSFIKLLRLKTNLDWSKWLP